jgi:small subunit ribosomal protein S1
MNRKFNRKPAARQQQDGPIDFNKLEEMAGAQLYNNVCTAQVMSVNGEVKVSISSPSGGAEITARVPSEEFGGALPVVGDSILIYLEDPPRTKEDVPVGSYLKAKELAEWIKVEEAFRSKSAVKGMIVGAIKGGFSISLFADDAKQADAGMGLRAFLPHRQAGFSAKDLPSVFSREPYELNIIDISPEGGSVVVTRRDVLQQERKVIKKEFWEHVKVGDVVEGIVRHLMPYGAFVEVNGADGLLHASDLAWHKQPRLEEILSVGQALSLKVIEADIEKRKLKLGLKQMTPDPWESIREHFRTGMEVEGSVVAIADFGVFMRLQDGIEGLIHLSEMSWQRFKHPSQKFKIGDTVRARILSLDQAHHRISLSTKALEANPIEMIAEKFPAGSVLRTKIAQIKDFGVFVELDPTVMGMVHIGELSWTKHVEHPNELYKEGQEIEVVVLGFDPERQRVSCSIKRLSEDPWAAWREKYANGTRHEVTVTKVVSGGAECELEPELIAFCPTKELAAEASGRAQDFVKMGQKLDVEVTNFDQAHHKITVSVKARADKEIREDYEQYMKKQNQSGAAKATMAEAVGASAHSKVKNV